MTKALMFLATLPAFLMLEQTAFAQSDFRRAEIFAGGSYLPAGPDDFPRTNSAGFQSSVSVNLNGWFGATGDLGAHFGNASVYEYLAGPRFTKRGRQFNVFVHGLIGGALGRTSLPGFSDNRFSLAGGGGVDIHLNERFSIRAAQVDWIGSFTDILEDNFRFGAGIVFKVGGSHER